jgi:hypothetical protein
MTSKTAKIAKADAKFRKEYRFGFQTDPLPSKRMYCLLPTAYCPPLTAYCSPYAVIVALTVWLHGPRSPRRLVQRSM